LSPDELASLLRYEGFHALLVAREPVGGSQRFTTIGILAYFFVFQIMVILLASLILEDADARFLIGMVIGATLVAGVGILGIWRLVQPVTVPRPDPMRLRRASRIAKGVFGYGLVYAAGFIGVSSIEPAHPDPLLITCVVLSFISAIAGVAGWAAIGVTALTDRAARRRRIVRAPTAVIVHELARALELSSVNSPRWLSPVSRRQIAIHLEAASFAIEYGLREQLMLGDRRSDVWAANDLQYIAAGVRDLKRWVAVPRMDTPEHFRSLLSSTLKLALSERWDEMRRVTPERIVRAPALTALLVACVALVACTAAGFGIWGYTKLALPTIPSYLLAPIAAIGLFLLTYVLSSIDPQLGSRLTMMRDVGASLSPLKPSNKP
jgi:hypothetical protein